MQEAKEKSEKKREDLPLVSKGLDNKAPSGIAEVLASFNPSMPDLLNKDVTVETTTRTYSHARILLFETHGVLVQTGDGELIKRYIPFAQIREIY